MVLINNLQYDVLKDEFPIVKHEIYFRLQVVKNLGYYERIVSLLSSISKLGVKEAVFYNMSHGGFIPIECIPFFTKINITKTDITHHKNIIQNIERHNQNEKTDIQLSPSYDEYNGNSILFSETASYISNSSSVLALSPAPFLLTSYSKKLSMSYRYIFQLSNTDLYLYVPESFYDVWYQDFHYYLQHQSNGQTILEYDNLMNLCIMVKNGGAQFEDMLKANLPIIDEWTILDTGSTDDTVDIIKRVLVDKKKGKLYQEPFTNFRDSRNRLLELAGESCKYTIMLDDTYVIQGDLRNFFNLVRGDQFATSYSLYVKSYDMEYISNRILKTKNKLRYLYKIHEVIQDYDNVNVNIPMNESHILDRNFEYMEERTMARKILDLKLLFEELEEDPNNSRTHYYLGQTYSLLNEYEKAFHYFLERMNHPNEGFLQERIDAIFEAARLANYKLNRPWSECEALYQKAYELDKSRPDSIYFMAVHYMNCDPQKAYEYFKLGFEIGYPLHCQYGLKPTLSFHFLPVLLAPLCYQYQNYELGEKCARLFLDNNVPHSNMYQVMDSWHKLFAFINTYLRTGISTYNFEINNTNNKPILCFVADGGFNKWSGSNILTHGVGGSETYIIEMSRHIQAQGHFKVIVFCNCEKPELFEGVQYYHLKLYFEFIKRIHVHTCIISRYSEYYPPTILSSVDNIYMVAHDLTLNGIVIPTHQKLRKIFCLTEWHVSHFEEMFPTLKGYFVPLYYGVNSLFDIGASDHTGDRKVKNRFIYSSFPDRGLLELLMMWPRIIDAHPDATLHIYTDVENEWVNRVQPELIQLVKQKLLELKNGKYGVTYCGWVTKTALADAWKQTEYWFYPCTFKETFCLTALEAAISKTVVITNDLAALQNTVGDRGLIIPGDASTVEWQTTAIKKLLELMGGRGGGGEAVENAKEKYIQRNYEWASKLSWKNQAMQLLDYFTMRKSVKNGLEYMDMYNWTNDIPLGHKKRFEDAIQHFNSNNQNQNANPQVLEVGTYTGTSLIGIVSKIPNSNGIGIDKWEDYNEEDNPILKSIQSNKIEERFQTNIKAVGMEDRIKGIKGNSTDVLMEFIRTGKMFDFIYVDGSHKCFDVCIDLFLSWQILNKNGILAIDDYLFYADRVKELPYEYPFEAVNDFLKKRESEYILLDKDYRVFIKKIV